MEARVRRCYAVERLFRNAGLLAVGVSMLFLAILLGTMAFKGLGGFTHYEAAVPVDFAKSDLFLDATTLRGPNGKEAVAGADLESAISRAAVETYGPAAEEMFGAGAESRLGKALLEAPGALEGKQTFWLPVGSAIDVAAKQDGDPVAEKLVAQLKAKNALRRTFNWEFLTSSDATDPSAVG